MWLEMKLIGSKTEQEIKEQLMLSKRSLFYEEEGKRLRNVLQQNFPLMTTAYILHLIPEQGEDIYKVLINDSLIVDVELDKHNHNIAPIINSEPVSKYKLGLSKINQIKLAVAIDLAKNDLK
jgi:hypothetical protein